VGAHQRKQFRSQEQPGARILPRLKSSAQEDASWPPTTGQEGQGSGGQRASFHVASKVNWENIHSSVPVGEFRRFPGLGAQFSALSESGLSAADIERAIEEDAELTQEAQLSEDLVNSWTGGCEPPFCGYPRLSVGSDHSIRIIRGECPPHRRERQERQRQDVLRQGGVPPHLVASTLSDFPFHPFLNVFVGRHVPGGLLIVGPEGIGKTRLAAALVHDWIHASDVSPSAPACLWMPYMAFRDVSIRRVAQETVPLYTAFLEARIAVLDGIFAAIRPTYVEEGAAGAVAVRAQANLPTIVTVRSGEFSRLIPAFRSVLSDSLPTVLTMGVAV
jgi:hypothetical protein